MVDQYTPLLRFVQQEDMTNTNQWGSIFNTGVIDLVEQALAGVTDVNVSFGDVALNQDFGAPDQSRSMSLNIIGLPGAVRTVTLPELQKLYIVSNNTDPPFSVLLKTAESASVEIVAGATTIIVVDGVTNEIRTFGVPDKIDFDDTWTQLALNVAGGAFAVNARYVKIGDLVSIQIPVFMATFSGMTMSLEADGGLPVEIQRPTLTTAIPLGFPLTVLDGASAVQAYFQMASGDATLDFVSADPGVTFVNNGERSLPLNFSFTYSVTDD